MKSKVAVAISLLHVAGCAEPGQPFGAVAELVAAGQFLDGRYSNDYGTRAYKLYVPSGYDGSKPVPLVLMLHGCTQNPEDFAAGTRMNELAEAETLLIVYAEQPASANASKCWNWFEPAHQERGRGEPSLLSGMTREVMAAYKIDHRRVYAAGLSAGAAMAVLLGAAYPDLYAAIGSHSGLEYRAAANALEAVPAMQMGGPDPDAQGRLAFDAMAERARMLPVIVFHGDLDLTVSAVNAQQTLSQWAQTADLADDSTDNATVDDVAEAELAGQVSSGHAYTRFVYRDARGVDVLEKWIVHGMTHRWSGGSSVGTYTDPKGPDASREMLRFFREHPRSGDSPPLP